jgi:hypothetical protein
LTSPREIHFTVLGESWEILLKDKMHSTLQTATRGQASLDNWEKYSDIHWQATGQAMAKVTISRRHWVRHIHDAPLGK